MSLRYKVMVVKIQGASRMTNIVFASHNLGKVREVQHLLHTDDIKLLTMGEAGLHDFMIEENGYTYEANATLKAKTVGDKLKLPTLADDSGIEVEALDGKPGIYSARYAKGSDADRVKKMLKEMEGKTNRKAKFVAIFVFYDPKTNLRKVFQGEVLGRISHTIMGEQGFGYDPIFIPDGYEKTMAELGVDQKNQISHRAKAAKSFMNWWESTLASK